MTQGHPADKEHLGSPEPADTVKTGMRVLERPQETGWVVVKLDNQSFSTSNIDVKSINYNINPSAAAINAQRKWAGSVDT